MTRRFVAALATGTFVLGALGGAAGVIVAREATPPSDMTALMAEHMADLGPNGMTTMMSMMGQQGPMGPWASEMPGSRHDSHHPAASAEAPE